MATACRRAAPPISSRWSVSRPPTGRMCCCCRSCRSGRSLSSTPGPACRRSRRLRTGRRLARRSAGRSRSSTRVSCAQRSRGREMRSCSIVRSRPSTTTRSSSTRATSGATSPAGSISGWPSVWPGRRSGGCCRPSARRARDGRRMLSANLHATHHASEPPARQAEVRRARDFFLALTQPEEIEVLRRRFQRPRSLRRDSLSSRRRVLRPRHGRGSCARARIRGNAPGALARRAPADRRRPRLRPRTTRGADHVSRDEARAAFPVLEHFAYLNAGSFGPLARTTVAAMEAQLKRGLAVGRSGGPFMDELTELRDGVRARLAASLERPAGERRTDDVDDPGMQHRDLRAPPAAGRRGRHDRQRALRVDRATPCLGRHRPRRATDGPARGRGFRRDRGRGHAEDPSDRHFARQLAYRPCAAARTAPGRLRRPAADRRRAVGRRDARRREPLRLLHRLRTEVAVRPGHDRSALRRRPGAARSGDSFLLRPAGVRAGGRLHREGGSRTLRFRLARPSVPRRSDLRDRHRSGMALRGCRRGRPRAAATCSWMPAWRSSPNRARPRSSPSSRAAILRKRWRPRTNTASSSASSRRRAGSARRAATGRTRRIWSG